ncbi:bifunctional UDP-N-acetylglucosamine diphosphorylase/glucosamine-1-phosphate N-acetyltransferase GlmU, partial [Geobacillus stearothermophilus]|nr:bifunctional UDP-N-acetylglucosamine diphosphorylase/glucosamine-1-phosphate N-acetyltransferase GlmU [Geobacillus stearothermophilus]
VAKGSTASQFSDLVHALDGADVPIGSGSMTGTYDGVHPKKTNQDDGAYIGCNVNLIAPVTVGRGAYVAAGSTITDDVPGRALAIARARQVNKEHYVDRLPGKKKS